MPIPKNRQDVFDEPDTGGVLLAPDCPDIPVFLIMDVSAVTKEHLLHPEPYPVCFNLYLLAAKEAFELWIQGLRSKGFHTVF